MRTLALLFFVFMCERSFCFFALRTYSNIIKIIFIQQVNFRFLYRLCSLNPINQPYRQLLTFTGTDPIERDLTVLDS